MYADQHKQIGIGRGATPLNMRTLFTYKAKWKLKKSQELKGRSEKFKNP
jgi:hypothetical protein